MGTPASRSFVKPEWQNSRSPSAERRGRQGGVPCWCEPWLLVSAGSHCRHLESLRQEKRRGRRLPWGWPPGFSEPGLGVAWGGSGQRGWLRAWSCRRWSLGTGEGAEAGAEVGSGGVGSRDILRGRPPGPREAPRGEAPVPRQEGRRAQGDGAPVGPGRRAPPSGAPRHSFPPFFLAHVGGLKKLKKLRGKESETRDLFRALDTFLSFKTEGII